MNKADHHSDSGSDREDEWKIPTMCIDPSDPILKTNSFQDPVTYLIDLEDLRVHERFPAFDHDVVTKSTEVDISNALVIFLSHAWVEIPMHVKSRRQERKEIKAGKVDLTEYWIDGAIEESSSDEEVVAERKRPKTPDGCIKAITMMDTFSQDKWKLTVEATDKIKEVYAPEMDKVYLWVDYCCLDPGEDSTNDNSLGERLNIGATHGLLMLDRIMKLCDCVLTVVVDKEYKDNPWHLSQSGKGLHKDYQSREWKRYLSRRWCRLEMAYGSNVPLPETEYIEADAVFNQTFDKRKNPLVGRVSENRAERLRGGLQYERLQARRAHLLYGTRESEINALPKVLPHLEKTVVDELYNPAGGHYSKPADAPVLEKLNRELWPFTLVGDAGYKGERDNWGAVGQVGRKHGMGTMSWPNGNEYIGNWDKNEMAGDGVYKHTQGKGVPMDIYTGKLENSVQHGRGTYERYDGACYVGDWKEGKRHGFGTFTWADGTSYRGYWMDDEREGFGLLTLAGKGHYKGNWVGGRRCGEGKMVWASGAEYQGMWKRDRRHGNGLYSSPYARGSTYSGGWKDGRKHGLGVLTIAPGKIEEEVYDGVFEADNFMESKAEEKVAQREAIQEVFEVYSDESENDLNEGEASDSEKHFFSRSMRIFRNNSPDISVDEDQKDKK